VKYFQHTIFFIIISINTRIYTIGVIHNSAGGLYLYYSETSSGRDKLATHKCKCNGCVNKIIRFLVKAAIK